MLKSGASLSLADTFRTSLKDEHELNLPAAYHVRALSFRYVAVDSILENTLIPTVIGVLRRRFLVFQSFDNDGFIHLQEFDHLLEDVTAIPHRFGWSPVQYFAASG